MITFKTYTDIDIYEYEYNMNVIFNGYNKSMRIYNSRGYLVGYRCKCIISDDNIRFLLNITRNDVGPRDMNRIYELAAMYGII